MRWSRIIEWGERTKPVGKKLRCSLLDADGRQCLDLATVVDTIHGDPELDPAWYAVPFCKRHLMDTARKADYKASPAFADARTGEQKNPTDVGSDR